MKELQLLIDLHGEGERQGPGADVETERALELAGLDRTTPLKIADLGCGTGASTLVLARFDAFLQRNGHTEEARAIVAAEQAEIELYEEHREHLSYGMYVARRLE